MAQEIELKFLISESNTYSISDLISTLPFQVISHHTKKLANTYFETDSRQLRKWDMGLRTRVRDQKIEQTIKTAGVVVGGLHQRPEYNVNIDKNWPDLSLFPKNIWSQDASVTAIQSQLEALFTTDFERSTWLLQLTEDTQVEVVYDTGAVTCQSVSRPIHEIELELVSGDVSEIFKLATLINQKMNVRLGYLSKAARGYQIADDWQTEVKSVIKAVDVKGGDNAEQAFQASLQTGLQFVQHHEQAYFENPSLVALRRVLDGIALVRHIIWLFAEMFDDVYASNLKKQLKLVLNQFAWVELAKQLKTLTSKKSSISKKLDVCEDLTALIEQQKGKAPSEADIKQIFWGTDYNAVMLTLTHLLVTKEWRNHMSPSHFNFAKRAISATAPNMLDQAWQQLLNPLQSSHSMTADEYVVFNTSLKRHLLTGVCVGRLFEKAQRTEFREPWIDLSSGIDELTNLMLLKQLCESSDSASTKKISLWLDDKLASLLIALEHTRKQITNLKPYW